MKNRGKNKSVAFIILFSVFSYMELYICKYINIGYTYNLTYMQYNVTYICEHECKIYVSKYEQIYCVMYNPKSEKVGTVWKTQIKKESSDF